MQPTITSEYFGSGKSAIFSPLNQEPLQADSENFRPIDFLHGSYSTCMMGIMDKVAVQNGFNLSEARTEINFEMLPDNSRIDFIDIKCYISKEDYSSEEKQILENAATKICPVGNSLHPDIKRRYTFKYGGK